MDTIRADAVVVGGGLAGLCAANRLADEGLTTCLIERTDTVGGRGSSVPVEGAMLNFGPHALYRGGTAERVLRRLGCWPEGGRPAAKGLLVGGGHTHALPGDLLTLLRTTALPGRSRRAFAWWFTRLLSGGAAPRSDEGAGPWLRRTVGDPEAEEVATTLLRLATYLADPSDFPATVGADLLKRATLWGVRYPHGGWGPMGENLRARLVGKGGRILLGHEVLGTDGSEVSFEGGRVVATRGVVLAVPLPAAARIVPGSENLQKRLAAAEPVRVAALDLVVEGALSPTIALGLGEPWYHSVHSAVARLCDPASSVLHLARPLRTGERAPTSDLLLQHLRTYCDLPDSRIRATRHHAAATVAWDQPRASAARDLCPTEAATDAAPRCFLAGCWVEGGSWLLDGTIGSAEAATAGVVRGIVKR